jgi:hypothetical protein
LVLDAQSIYSYIVRISFVYRSYIVRISFVYRSVGSTKKKRIMNGGIMNGLAQNIELNYNVYLIQRLRYSQQMKIIQISDF